MKKISIYPAAAITLFFIAGTGVAAAQTTSVPPSTLLAPAASITTIAPSVTEPAIVTPALNSATTNLQPFTPEPEPAPNQPASTTVNTTPQPVTPDTSSTGTTTGNTAATSTGARTTVDTRDDNTATILNLPEPELPVLDLGTTLETEEAVSTGQIPITDSTEACIDPRQAQTAILSPAIGNQIKISWLVFLGATLGAILWILSHIFINTARTRREILRLTRQNRQADNARKSGLLQNCLNSLTDPLSNLVKYSGNKTILDKKSLMAYRDAAIDIELFGSNEALAAHQKILNLVSGASHSTPEDFETARLSLLSALKKDIGLKEEDHTDTASRPE